MPLCTVMGWASSVVCRGVRWCGVCVVVSIGVVCVGRGVCRGVRWCVVVVSIGVLCVVVVSIGVVFISAWHRVV